MSQFQAVLGVILIISAIIIVTIAIFNLLILKDIETNNADPKSTITRSEKNAVLVTEIILILIGIILGIYGIMVVMPRRKHGKMPVIQYGPERNQVYEPVSRSMTTSILA